VRGRTGPGLAAAAFLPEHAPPLVVRADLPHRAVRHLDARGGDRVVQQAIPELGVLAVSVEDRVRRVGLVVLGVGDRPAQPGIVVLAVEPRAPGTPPPPAPESGHRGRPTPLRAGRAFSRQVALRQVRRSPTQHLVLLLQQPVTALELTQLSRRIRGHTRLGAVLDISLTQPLLQRHLVNTEVRGDLRQSHTRLAVTRDPDDVLTELTGIRLGHNNILPRPPLGKRTQMSHTPSAAPYDSNDMRLESLATQIQLIAPPKVLDAAIRLDATIFMHVLDAWQAVTRDELDLLDTKELAEEARPVRR